MREIEFRAFLKKEKKMVEVISINTNDKLLDYIDNEKKDLILGTSFDDAELMQYTGKKDKNGKKIFEGDIVKDEKGRLFVIEYKFGGFNLAPLMYFNDEFSWNPLGDMQTAGFLQESCEVIKNIWENPELLGVE